MYLKITSAAAVKQTNRFLTVLWTLRMSETDLGLRQVGCSRCVEQRRRTTCHQYDVCVRGTCSWRLTADLIPGRRSTLAWMTELPCSLLRSTAMNAFVHQSCQLVTLYNSRCRQPVQRLMGWQASDYPRSSVLHWLKSLKLTVCNAV